MILEARNWSRLWMMVTSVAKRVRKRASSIAESPPPITLIGLLLKKNPSQVAQEETPCPLRACSLGIASQRADAPLAMIRVWVWISLAPIFTLNGRLLRLAPVTWSV